MVSEFVLESLIRCARCKLYIYIYSLHLAHHFKDCKSKIWKYQKIIVILNPRYKQATTGQRWTEIEVISCA